MGDAALSSDHVNYLILRYLQENGHETSAKAFYRDWNRADEFSDPEKLPFASVVGHNELVYLVQDGLFHDQLQAMVTNNNRRFNLTRSDFSRPSSSHKIPPKPTVRRPSAYVQPDQEDFPTPAAKRPRRSDGSEAVINGDAMDVDRRQDEDDDETLEQERAQSEIEPTAEEEPVEMTTAATQTDRKSRVITKTLYWALNKTEPTLILHTAWNPQRSLSTRLLTAGEALCRLYHVSAPDYDGECVPHAVPLDIASDATISAVCWHPSGRYYTFAMEKPTEEGQQLFDCDAEGNKRPFDMSLYPLEPPGTTLTMRYSSSGDLMLTVSTNGQRGLLQIWPTAATVRQRDSIASNEFNQVVFDAVWVSEDSVAICGKGLVAVYTIQHVPNQNNGVLNSDGAAAGATHNVSEIFSYPTTTEWDKIRFDDVHGVLVVSSSPEKEIMFFTKKGRDWTEGPKLGSFEPRGVIALAFQPLSDDQKLSITAPRRLAAIRESGDVQVYNMTASSCTQAGNFSIGPRDAVLALSWAPSEPKLAVASDESIKVWDVEASEEVVSWQAAPAKWYQENNHNLPGDEDAQAEPSLSWNANGDRLALAVGRKVSLLQLFSYMNVLICIQIAIISLLPSADDADMMDADSA